MATSETEWDDTERAWMMALVQYRISLCPYCGGDMDETTNAGNEENYHRLEPIQCFRCVEFARSHADYRDLPFPETLLHRVELKRRG